MIDGDIDVLARAGEQLSHAVQHANAAMATDVPLLVGRRSSMAFVRTSFTQATGEARSAAESFESVNPNHPLVAGVRTLANSLDDASRAFNPQHSFRSDAAQGALSGARLLAQRTGDAANAARVGTLDDTIRSLVERPPGSADYTMEHGYDDRLLASFLSGPVSEPAGQDAFLDALARTSGPVRVSQRVTDALRLAIPAERHPGWLRGSEGHWATSYELAPAQRTLLAHIAKPNAAELIDGELRAVIDHSRTSRQLAGRDVDMLRAIRELPLGLRPQMYDEHRQQIFAALPETSSSYVGYDTLDRVMQLTRGTLMAEAAGGTANALAEVLAREPSIGSVRDLGALVAYDPRAVIVGSATDDPALDELASNGWPKTLADSLANVEACDVAAWTRVVAGLRDPSTAHDAISLGLDTSTVATADRGRNAMALASYTKIPDVLRPARAARLADGTTGSLLSLALEISRERELAAPKTPAGYAGELETLTGYRRTVSLTTAVRQMATIAALPDDLRPPLASIQMPYDEVERLYMHDANDSYDNTWQDKFNAVATEIEVRASLATEAQTHPGMTRDDYDAELRKLAMAQDASPNQIKRAGLIANLPDSVRPMLPDGAGQDFALGANWTLYSVRDLGVHYAAADELGQGTADARAEELGTLVGRATRYSQLCLNSQRRLAILASLPPSERPTELDDELADAMRAAYTTGRPSDRYDLILSYARAVAAGHRGTALTMARIDDAMGFVDKHPNSESVARVREIQALLNQLPLGDEPSRAVRTDALQQTGKLLDRYWHHTAGYSTVHNYADFGALRSDVALLHGLTGVSKLGTATPDDAVSW